jgi:hypothetical protein
MRLGDSADDRQPEAEAIAGAGAVRAATLERLKQLGDLIRMDHRASVRHR